jgi:hypothetical protein
VHVILGICASARNTRRCRSGCTRSAAAPRAQQPSISGDEHEQRVIARASTTAQFIVARVECVADSATCFCTRRLACLTAVPAGLTTAGAAASRPRQPACSTRRSVTHLCTRRIACLTAIPAGVTTAGAAASRPRQPACSTRRSVTRVCTPTPPQPRHEPPCPAVVRHEHKPVVPYLAGPALHVAVSLDVHASVLARPGLSAVRDVDSPVSGHAAELASTSDRLQRLMTAGRPPLPTARSGSHSRQERLEAPRPKTH